MECSSTLCAVARYDRLGRHTALIALDGACEYSLWLATQHLGLPAKPASQFHDLLTTTGNVLKDWNQPGRRSVIQMRNARNQAQHGGALPDPARMPEWRDGTGEFVRSLAEAAYGQVLDRALYADSARRKLDMDATMMRAGLWSGVVLVVGMVIAQGFLMRFIPAPSPDLSAQELTQKFLERRDETRVGTILLCILWSFYPTWGIAMMVFLRKMERGYPFLSYSSIALIGGGSVFFILIPMTWAVIAFRADTLDPEIIQIMNDWVWFDWLFTWPPFALWMIVIGAAIMRDQNYTKLYPRWVAYFNFWSALFIFPAGLIVFFKTGPFAYDGFGAFWFPFAVFFGWMITMTVVTFQAIRREEERLQAIQEEEDGPDPSPADVPEREIAVV